MSGEADSDWLKVVARLKFEKRYAEALEIIRPKAAAGNHAAKVHLAILGDKAGLSRADTDRILAEVEATMDPTDADAHWLLSRAYDLRLSDIPYDEMDRRCFEHVLATARLNDNAIDAYAVATFYAHGSLTTAIDLAEAERWFEEAMKRGHPDADRALRRLHRTRKKSPHK